MAYVLLDLCSQGEVSHPGIRDPRNRRHLSLRIRPNQKSLRFHDLSTIEIRSERSQHIDDISCRRTDRKRLAEVRLLLSRVGFHLVTAVGTLAVT